LALANTNQTGPINLGNPNEFTMLELAELVMTTIGRQVPIVFEPLPSDDPMQRKPDITLARTLLGWEPTVQLAQGLERTVHWMASR
jgi:nucleoside-diphosphate-sugar epimerase